MTSVSLSSLPQWLEFDQRAHSWRTDGQALMLTAGRLTDLFLDPLGVVKVTNSPRLLFKPHPEFMLTAHVQVNFAATFDAGVLIVYLDGEHWAKLCFEYSPQGEPMIVSVVNKITSDDCNSVVVEGNQVYLRVSGLAGAYAFHYSLDGQRWHMVRYFNLGSDNPARIGFSVQSPTGEGCQAIFDQIAYTPQRLADLRSGV